MASAVAVAVAGAAALCAPVTTRAPGQFARVCSASLAARQPISCRDGAEGKPLVSRRNAALQLVWAAGALDLSSHGAAAAAAAAAAAPSPAPAESRPRQFHDLDDSGGVKALEIREGAGGTPHVGDKVAIHYYARLAAKQGWRFDSSYEHKDQFGVPEPFEFVIGDGTVITGLDTAVRTMREGGVRRVVIPPSQGYQNRLQGPIPPNFSDRQRLYTTIFNPTRIANGEGSTLGTLVFDIEFLGIRSARS